MIRHLELTTTLTAQQAILLQNLPNWEQSQLEDILLSLQATGIVVLTNLDQGKRRISIDGSAPRNIHLTSAQSALLTVLDNFLPKP